MLIMKGAVAFTEDRSEIIGDADVEFDDVIVHSARVIDCAVADDNVPAILMHVGPVVPNVEVIAPSHDAPDVVKLRAFPVPLLVKSVPTHSKILPPVISTVLHRDPVGVVSDDS